MNIVSVKFGRKILLEGNHEATLYTEKEFVQSIIAPYLQSFEIFSVIPILIRTSKTGKGGFVNYEHLKRDALRLLKSSHNDIIVSMLVDFFRCPELPFKERWGNITNHQIQVNKMEMYIAEDINNCRFIPYIQLHEFEALLFTSNAGFQEYFTASQQAKTNQIIQSYPNPEDINSSPEGAPSKRILAIEEKYDKVLEGNLIALCVGIEKMLEKCPRFKRWIEKLVEKCKE